LVFALLGFPLALRFSRGGAGLVIGVSVAVFAVYYVGLIAGEDLGDRLIVSPFVSMWMPNVIFTVVGAGLLFLVRHEGGHARSGSWGVASWLARLRRGGRTP
jgi:lipopolysaccharide export system permease protein